MKIDLMELKKAVGWIEANTSATVVSVNAYDHTKLIIKTYDKYDQEVEVILYTDNIMLPKIRKTGNL